jgi:hypothetical protein
MTKMEKWVITTNMVSSVSASIEADSGMAIQTLVSAYWVPIEAKCWILHQQRGLVTKLARWIPRLLSDDQMVEQVQTSQAFIDQVWRAGKSVMNQIIITIITMDQSAVSIHTLLKPSSNLSSGLTR